MSANAGAVKLRDGRLDVGSTTLLGICCSLKPGPEGGGRSAARTMLIATMTRVGTVYPDCRVLDLRDYPIPQFDGRFPDVLADGNVNLILDAVRQAGALFLTVPAYWSGVSGVFKNLIDVLCGPAYDMPSPSTVFTDKPVGVLVIGADELSAQAGGAQAMQILASCGAVLRREPVVVGDPRTSTVLPERLADCLAVAADLAIGLHRTPATGDHALG